MSTETAMTATMQTTTSTKSPIGVSPDLEQHNNSPWRFIKQLQLNRPPCIYLNRFKINYKFDLKLELVVVSFVTCNLKLRLTCRVTNFPATRCQGRSRRRKCPPSVSEGRTPKNSSRSFRWFRAGNISFQYLPHTQKIGIRQNFGE